MNDLKKCLGYLYSAARKRLIHLNLQILYQCNFRCAICDFWKESYQTMPVLSAANVEVIAGKLRRIGPMVVSIGGGEPLLHPELPDIIRILKRDHFPVMICNGWFITPETAAELFRAGLYEVSVSLDYATAGRHDEMRNAPGAFDRACSALKALMMNRTSANQRVHLIAVVMEDNLDEIEPLILKARELGVSTLVTMYSHGRGAKPSRTGHKEVSARLLELKQKYPDFVALRSYLARFSEASAGEIRPCYAGRNLFNIDCQGNVSRCIDRIEAVAGNMLTDDPETIVASLLNQHGSNDCGACWTSCRGNFETMLYGPNRLANLRDCYAMIKRVPLPKGVPC